ncbi:MAG: 3-deoxy-7-phosphoheptulonate synthase [Steroidobacteraceae bacterium]
MTQHSAHPWEPSGWRRKVARQAPAYPDAARLEAMVAEIARLPPIVVSWEVDQLRTQLAEAQRGERFLLQGGDCAGIPAAL